MNTSFETLEEKRRREEKLRRLGNEWDKRITADDILKGVEDKSAETREKVPTAAELAARKKIKKDVVPSAHELAERMKVKNIEGFKN
jgi:fumarate hydratase class II